MHLVEEGEALRPLEAALLELHHDAALAQQDHLAVVVVEVDAARHVRQPLLEQPRRHLEVGEARHERARVDERVQRRPPARHLREDRVDRPAVGQRRRPHHRRRRQVVEHLRVVARREEALAELLGQQRRRRPREAEAPPEEQVAAQLLPRRRELHLLEGHRGREDVLVQKVVHELRLQPQQPEERRHLLGVAEVDQMERPHLLLGVAVAVALTLALALALVVAAVGAAAAVVKEAVAAEPPPRRAAHPRAGALDPSHEATARLALVVRAVLLRHQHLEAEHHRHEVGLAQALVAEGEDRQRDDHVGVRELRRARRRVLAHERHREQLARRRVGAQLLLLREHAEGDAVDLGQHKRQDVREQLVREVEHLEQRRLGAQRAQLGSRDDLVGRQPRRRRPVLEVPEHLGVGESLEAELQQQQQQPVGQQPLEARVVEVGIEQHEVRHTLQRAALDALLERGADALQQPLRLHRARHLHHADALRREEERIEGVEGQLPPQPRRELVGGEVERQLLAQRPVELALERVQQQIDLVHDEAAAVEDLEHVAAALRLLVVGGERLEVLGRRRGAAEEADLAAEGHQAAALLVLLRLAREIVEMMHDFEELERKRLERRGRRDDDGAPLDRRAELHEQRGRHVDRSLEVEGVDGLRDERREPLAQHSAREGEEGGRHHEHHELRAVGEEQREERRDAGGLAGAHDELRDQRAALGQRGDEALDELDLRRAQHHARRELEHEEARVVARALGARLGARRDGRAPAARARRLGAPHVVALHSERRRERRRLEGDVLFRLCDGALAHRGAVALDGAQRREQLARLQQARRHVREAVDAQQRRREQLQHLARRGAAQVWVEQRELLLGALRQQLRREHRHAERRLLAREAPQRECQLGAARAVVRLAVDQRERRREPPRDTLGVLLAQHLQLLRERRQLDGGVLERRRAQQPALAALGRVVDATAHLRSRQPRELRQRRLAVTLGVLVHVLLEPIEVGSRHVRLRVRMVRNVDDPIEPLLWRRQRVGAVDSRGDVDLLDKVVQPDGAQRLRREHMQGVGRGGGQPVRAAAAAALEDVERMRRVQLAPCAREVEQPRREQQPLRTRRLGRVGRRVGRHVLDGLLARVGVAARLGGAAVPSVPYLVHEHVVGPLDQHAVCLEREAAAGAAAVLEHALEAGDEGGHRIAVALRLALLRLHQLDPLVPRQRARQPRLRRLVHAAAVGGRAHHVRDAAAAVVVVERDVRLRGEESEHRHQRAAALPTVPVRGRQRAQQHLALHARRVGRQHREAHRADDELVDQHKVALEVEVVEHRQHLAQRLVVLVRERVQVVHAALLQSDVVGARREDRARSDGVVPPRNAVEHVLLRQQRRRRRLKHAGRLGGGGGRGRGGDRPGRGGGRRDRGVVVVVVVGGGGGGCDDG